MDVVQRTLVRWKLHFQMAPLHILHRVVFALRDLACPAKQGGLQHDGQGLMDDNIP